MLKHLFDPNGLKESVERLWIAKDGTIYSVGKNDHCDIFVVTAENCLAIDEMIDGWVHVSESKKGAQWRVVGIEKILTEAQKATLIAIGRSPEDPECLDKTVTFEDVRHLACLPT